MSAPILIKRYPNRRLYDTGQSKYITLEDLAEQLGAGVEVRVVDARTDEDLTRRILLQVLLLDDQARKLDCLPVDFLRTLIRLKDPSMLKLFEHSVATTLHTFTLAQQAMQSNLDMLSRLAPGPMEVINSLRGWLRRGDEEKT